MEDLPPPPSIVYRIRCMYPCPYSSSSAAALLHHFSILPHTSMLTEKFKIVAIYSAISEVYLVLATCSDGPGVLFFFFLKNYIITSTFQLNSSEVLPSAIFCKAVVTGVVPFPPRYVPSIFIAHRVQHPYCSPIFIECC